jgi:transcriptional regulator with PAS, ATPase and Fis domain
VKQNAHNPKHTLIGTSGSMEALRNWLPKVAKSSASVLITGETGTGKECVAHTIHALSQRASGNFVVVNCGALPDSLIESELFGHVRGAFTGAHANVRGKIAHAHGGTLFLDEIGELSPYAQSKLLRVLESHEIQSLGSHHSERIDIRVLAATNRELEHEVAHKRFRPDLFYRLNVARLILPPLRERKSDIPLLASHVIAELNQRENGKVSGLAPALMACLQAHDWPGNVRELRNLLESAFIDPPEGLLELEHLPPAFQSLFGQYRLAPQSELSHMLSVLERHQWNKAEAAKTLNCSRMTLYRKLAKYRVAEKA